MVRSRDPRTPVSAALLGAVGPKVHASDKIGPVNLDHTGASAPTPSPIVGGGETRTQMYTYLTRLTADRQTPVLYNGDRLWTKLTLTLETAGPVAIGNQANLYPVLGGTGVLLETDEPYEVIIAKGTRLYIAANNVNRVKVKIEALPWMEQITATLMQMVGGIMARFTR